MTQPLENKKAVILLSGGYDSSYLLWYLVQNYNKHKQLTALYMRTPTTQGITQEIIVLRLLKYIKTRLGIDINIQFMCTNDRYINNMSCQKLFAMWCNEQYEKCNIKYDYGYISRIWDDKFIYLTPIFKETLLSNLNTKLSYPLKNVNKLYIIESLPEDIRSLPLFCQTPYLNDNVKSRYFNFWDSNPTKSTKDIEQNSDLDTYLRCAEYSYNICTCCMVWEEEYTKRYPIIEKLCPLLTKETAQKRLKINRQIKQIRLYDRNKIFRFKVVKVV